MNKTCICLWLLALGILYGFWANAPEIAKWTGIVKSTNQFPKEENSASRVILGVPHLRQELNLCVPTSAAMVLDYYGDPRSPRELKVRSRGRAYDANAPFDDFTMTWYCDLIAGMKPLGYDWHEWGFPNTASGLTQGLEAIRSSLRRGDPVLIDVAASPSHTFVVAGFDDDKRQLLIIDPGIGKPGLYQLTYEHLASIWNSLSHDVDERSAIFTGRRRDARSADRLDGPWRIRADELPAITNSIGIRMKLIPAGTFTMGDMEGDADETPHEVTLTQPFYLGVTEVTNAQWRAVMGSVPSYWKDADHPVEQVSWDDAVAFCKKLSAMPDERAAGREYRLPTEAEWEYACRAGTATAYSFGDDESSLGEFAWFDRNSNSQTQPVGCRQPNGWGLYDMHGNVWEWCSDWYNEDWCNKVTDPTGPLLGSFRVSRGGGLGNIAWFCRSAVRIGDTGDDSTYRKNFDQGFRLALSPSGAKLPEAGKQVAFPIVQSPAHTTPVCESGRITPASTNGS